VHSECCGSQRVNVLVICRLARLAVSNGNKCLRRLVSSDVCFLRALVRFLWQGKQCDGNDVDIFMFE
jgi:hypothetical protein